MKPRRDCRPPWEKLRDDIRVLRIKLAAVALRDVTILHEVRALADLAKHFDCNKRKAVRLDLSFGLVKLKHPKGNMTTLELTNEQEIDVTINPKTSSGKPAKIDGVPTWTIQSGSSATVIPTTDGKTATLRTVDDAEGDTVILVEADADMGDGFEALDETITLKVSSPKAASLGLTVSEPRQKTVEAPPPSAGGDKEAPKAKSKKR